jgi:hypothetical protein
MKMKMKTSTNMIALVVNMALLSTAIGDNLQGLSGGFVPKEKTVYLIRHADKHGENGQLCSAGLYRAEQLKQVFSGKQSGHETKFSIRICL